MHGAVIYCCLAPTIRAFDLISREGVWASRFLDVSNECMLGWERRHVSKRTCILMSGLSWPCRCTRPLVSLGDQQHRHHLGTHWQYRISTPSPSLCSPYTHTEAESELEGGPQVLSSFGATEAWQYIGTSEEKGDNDQSLLLSICYMSGIRLRHVGEVLFFTQLQELNDAMSEKQ